jgi:hypothetical protein
MTTATWTPLLLNMLPSKIDLPCWAPAKVRLLAGESETNRALVPSRYSHAFLMLCFPDQSDTQRLLDPHPSKGVETRWQPRLANRRAGAHIRGMEKYRSRMLEVTVTSHPPHWEWEVTSKGEMIANGFEREQVAAKFEGYNAMFLLLAAGWNP